MVISLLLLIISEVMRTQRKLQEDQLERVKEIEYSPAARALWGGTQHQDAADPQQSCAEWKATR
ncbi:hypothetical protein [Bifidobacterium sp. UTBIF-68]|nr:hypothetical protein [Bifidobacterium sp. UTBIF-68]